MLINLLNSFLADYNVILLVVNILLIIGFVIMFILFNKRKNRWDILSNYLGDITKTVDSVRYGNLTKKIEVDDTQYSGKLTESLNRMIESLSDREKMVVEYQTELKRQNKFLEAVINSLSDGFVIINNENVILKTTQNVASWFCSDGKKIQGNNLQNFIEVSNKKPIKLLKNDEIIIPSSKASNFLASTVELKLEDKKARFIVIIKNVTDQKELETLKEDFIATLTHDLKIPIIAEKNMIELFLDKKFGEISDKQIFALQNMENSNMDLLELVQTVLDTYKFKDGKITLNKENFLLKGFINEIITDMLPIASKTENKIIFSSSRDIKVFADAFQLKRVVKNLIQNAISYGEQKSPITISIGEIPQYVIIKVRDVGAGISKEDIDKIFNRYYSAAKKFKKVGTGLGLYLSLQILKAHNGDLTVESIKGEYTEFCIKIPI